MAPSFGHSVVWGIEEMKLWCILRVSNVGSLDCDVGLVIASSSKALHFGLVRRSFPVISHAPRS